MFPFSSPASSKRRAVKNCRYPWCYLAFQTSDSLFLRADARLFFPALAGIFERKLFIILDLEGGAWGLSLIQAPPVSFPQLPWDLLGPLPPTRKKTTTQNNKTWYFSKMMFNKIKGNKRKGTEPPVDREMAPGITFACPPPAPHSPPCTINMWFHFQGLRC